jgi:ribosomal protein L9
MAEMEREKQAKKEERRLAREAKKQARLEQDSMALYRSISCTVKTFQSVSNCST